MRESDIHISVADYLDRSLPPGTMWSTIGHGGMPLHPRTAARLKRQGLRPGIPDVLVVYQGRAIFIELKRPGGRLSSAQKTMAEAIMLAGGIVEVCRSVDEVEEFLGMLMPLAARVSA